MTYHLKQEFHIKFILKMFPTYCSYNPMQNIKYACDISLFVTIPTAR